MKILVGQVRSNVDQLSRGVLSVNSKDEGLINVYYTSPFGAGFSPEGKAGFFALPATHSWILFVKTDTAPYDYYYISTIHRDLNENTADSPQVTEWAEKGQFPPGLYNSKPGHPSRVIISDGDGNKVSLNHVADKFNGLIKGVELKSSDKKRLVLSDSPQAYGIFLVNEDNEGLVIGSAYKSGFSAGPLLAPRQIDLSTRGKINVFSRESAINLEVNNGFDITIKNTSTGVMNPLATLLPMSPLGVFKPYGNVKISSDARDIYIGAGEGHKFNQTLAGAAWSPFLYKSRVMMRAYGHNGTIQINSDGKIIIRCPYNDLYIHGKTVNIIGEDEVNIHSRFGDVNTCAGLNIKMSAMIVGETPRPGAAPFEPAATIMQRPPNPDLVEQNYDANLSIARTTSEAVPQPTLLSHIELTAQGVAINGPKIDLAPLIPTFRAKKANHPLWELGDYEANPASQS